MTVHSSKAISTLIAIAKARLGSPSRPRPLPSELSTALRAACGDIIPQQASEAELAQAALDVLAQDPEYTEPIQTMLAHADGAASNQKYIDPTSIALTAAAILVLQTRMKFKADSAGKWSIELEKKDSGDGALKLLGQRLLPFLDK